MQSNARAQSGSKRLHRSRHVAERERGIADCVAAYGSPLVQAGLFDSRALKQKRAGDERRDTIRTGKRGSQQIFSKPTRAFVWRTTPSSSWSSSYARGAERLACIALLRRANSAAGILRPARRCLARGCREIVRSLVAHPGLPARAGVEHPIDLGRGCHPACRAPWIQCSSCHGRRSGHPPRLADRLERPRRAGRRDVEHLARQPVA